jgi:beta-galactosidase
MTTKNREDIMNNAFSLNLDWRFRDDFDESYIGRNNFDDFKKVNIPHTVRELPYDCFDEKLTCMISTYVRSIELPKLEAKRVIIVFEGVSACFTLYINQKAAGSHKGAYSSSLFDITDFVHQGDNQIMLVVDSNERDEIPPNGSTVDYLIYGGIYRDVTLFITGQAYIKQTLIRYSLDGIKASVFPELFLENYGNAFVSMVKVGISKSGKVVISYEQTLKIPEGPSLLQLKEQGIGQVELWDLENPNLYSFDIELFKEGKLIDSFSANTGFRTVKATAKGFFLNGRKLKLIGMNRHQSYPYVGYAMGKKPQRKDAEILKMELAVNIVRCSHYMQSRYFLDRCDEIGLMVFEEVPGWGFIGDENYKKIIIQDLENMVKNHFNHPSIVIWGTRLNETNDDNGLYSMTNSLCKAIDPSRPTSGARWHTKSPLLEDIYSYNDYTPASRGEFVLMEPRVVTGLTYSVPYLVSEHSASLAPTSPNDGEERQEQFALQHAKVLNTVRAREDFLGAIGWCMFDYNTHGDHDIAQKICFHGVMDMFRVPKLAALFYKSQQDPSRGIVLQPCFMGGRGLRFSVIPFFVFTNCDYIEVKFSHDIVRRFFPSIKYPNLLHPPIEVNENGEFWQTRWIGAYIAGFVDGKEVVRCRYTANPRLSKMLVRVDESTLRNDCVEETRIVCTFTDENLNRLYYFRGVAVVATEGDIELIGPEIIPTLGGTVAFWIKTKATGKTGKAKVKIHCTRSEIKDETVEIDLL